MAPSTLNNKVNPLTWNVPIVDTKTGNPTPEFQRKWQQQAAANASVTDLTTAKAVSAVIDLISSTVGALLVRGASQWTGLVPVADGRVLRDKGIGATPIWDTISSIIDTLGAVQGDVLYRDAAAWKVLAPGTAGQVLTTGGAAANPSWQTSSAGGGAVASVNDDGTNFYMALMDVDGQLILDGSGDPVYLPEVLPPAALPLASSSAFGAVKVDGSTITALAGVISSVAALPAAATFLSQRITSAQAVTDGVFATVILNSLVLNTLGSQYDTGTGIFTPTKAGKYICWASIQGQVGTSISSVNCFITKNGLFGSGGTLIASGQSGPSGSGFSLIGSCFGIVDMNGSTDTLRLSGEVNGTGGSNTVLANSTFFGALYVGP